VAAAVGARARGAARLRGHAVADGGPYFVDEKLNRGDIRRRPDDGRREPRRPLALRVAVSRVDGRACAQSPAPRSTSGSATRSACTRT
jgi:hypothetical protein